MQSRGWQQASHSVIQSFKSTKTRIDKTSTYAVYTASTTVSHCTKSLLTIHHYKHAIQLSPLNKTRQDETRQTGVISETVEQQDADKTQCIAAATAFLLVYNTALLSFHHLATLFTHHSLKQAALSPPFVPKGRINWTGLDILPCWDCSTHPLEHSSTTPS